MWHTSRKIKKNRSILNKKTSLSLFIAVTVILCVTFFPAILKKFDRTLLTPIPNFAKFDIAKDSPATVKKQQLAKLLAKKAIVYESLTSSGSAYLLRLKNGEEILFSSSKPFDQQLASLQLILSRLTIEGKSFARLDFRYDKPLLVLP